MKVLKLFVYIVGILALIPILIFILIWLLELILSIPIPVSDKKFRDELLDGSAFMFHDTLWIHGGHHDKKNSKSYELNFPFGSRTGYEIEKIPNTHVYVTTDKEIIAKAFKFDVNYLQLDSSKITKLANKTIEHDIDRRFKYHINFNGKVFIIGGKNNESGGRYGDVWVTSNGTDWEQLLKVAPWAEENKYRKYHKMVVFNNKIILAGGEEEYNIFKRDVWTSSDGIKWEFITNIDGIEKVDDIFVYKNRLYLLGLKKNSKKMLLMSSNDIESWEIHDDISDFVSEGDKFFERNGYLMLAKDNGTWKFEDGNWKAQFSLSDFGTDISIIDDTIYNIIVNGSCLIKSADGVNWYFDGKHRSIELSPDKNFTPKNYEYTTSKIIEFKDTLRVLDGTKGLTDYSVDGLNWEAAKKTMPENMFYPRKYFETVVFKDKLWVLGGTHYKLIDTLGSNSISFKLRDIWYTADGTHWTEAPNNFEGRFENFHVVVNNDMLYLISRFNPIEIWTTENGFEWDNVMSIDDVDEEKASFNNVLIFDSKIQILYSDGYMTLESNGKSKFTELKKDNVSQGHYKRPEPLKDSLGNILFVTKEGDKLFVITDIYEWKPINYTMEDSSYYAPSSTLVEFKGDLYFVKEDYYKVVSSTKVELGEISK